MIFKHFFPGIAGFSFLIISLMLLTGCSNDSEINISESLNDSYAKESFDAEDYDEAYSDKEYVADSIFVQVCGFVKRPGVYEMHKGSRVYEVIERAGGVKSQAAENYVNQAELLTDGQQIYIPSKKELEDLGEGMDAGKASALGGLANQSNQGCSLININTADIGELTSISGIGKSRAADIVAYRNEHGGFMSIEEIKQVPGIKDGLFAKIKDQITVR